MARIIEFQGRRIELPDGATDEDVQRILMQGATPPAAAAPAAPPEVPRPTDVGPGASEGRPGLDPLRLLMAAGQGLGSAAAKLPLMPFDLLSGAANIPLSIRDTVQPWLTGKPSYSGRWAAPSDILRDAAFRDAKALGLPVLAQEEMSPLEHTVKNAIDFGGQGFAGGAALARWAAARAPEVAATGSRWFDSLLRPYATNPTRAVAGDVATGTGAGSGVTVAERYAPDSPMAAMLASLAGGVAGVGSLGAVTTTGQLAKQTYNRVTGQGIDKTPGLVQKLTDDPIRKDAVDTAAGIVQRAAARPVDDSLERMVANRTALEPELPVMPSAAALTQDPGLLQLEKGVRLDPKGGAVAMARDQDFRSGVRDTIERAVPPGGEVEALLQMVRRTVDERIGEAQGGVRKAEDIAGKVDVTRRAEGERTFGPYVGADAKTDASRRLDKAVIQDEYVPARTAKNMDFERAPGREVVVDANDNVLRTADRLRADASRITPGVLPDEFLQGLERLRPTAPEGSTPPAPVTVGELADMRPMLATASEKARLAGNHTLAGNIDLLRGEINRVVDATPGYEGAQQRYRESFAPTYRGPGGPGDAIGDFTRRVDRDPNRVATPPEKTAKEFLQAGAPERRAALARVIDRAQDPTAGRTAARDYLMSDLTASGALDQATGTIRAERIQTWRNKWGNLDDVSPGLNRELDDIVAGAQRGEQAATTAKAGVKEMGDRLTATERELVQEFGNVANPHVDPARILNETMAGDSRGTRLNRLIQLTEGNPRARDGLKVAFRNWLVDRAEGTATEKMRPGDERGPVSPAKLTAIFQDHAEAIAKIFDGPGEMNALRAGHKALSLAKGESNTAVTGSSTVSNANIVDELRDTSLGRGLEAALRAKYGMLRAGGMFATARRAFSGVTNTTATQAAELVERAAFDPQLMELLLGRKLPIGGPRWNARLNAILGGAEGARETAPGEDDEMGFAGLYSTGKKKP